MLSRSRIAASLGVLVLLAAYTLLAPPERVGATYLELCPDDLAGLKGVDLSFEQAVLDDLDADAHLVRQYDAAGSTPVWLVIVYFENARLGAHDAELCYRSQGFQVNRLASEQVQTSLGSVPLQVFQAKQGTRLERVSYFWYTAGRQALGEVKAFRDQMFLQGLKSNRSFGAFVRISTDEAGNPSAARERLHAFVRDLAPHLPEFFPESTGDDSDRERERDGRGPKEATG